MPPGRPKRKKYAPVPPPPEGFGLSPKNFPRNLRGYVDQDYISKLNAEEKEWLRCFNECHYGADFRKDPEGKWSTELRREAYKAKNAANRGDAYGVYQAVGNLRFAGDKPLPSHTQDADFSPTPKYLSSPEYKEALNAYRQALKDKADPSTQAALRRKVELFTYEATHPLEAPSPPSRSSEGPTGDAPGRPARRRRT